MTELLTPEAYVQTKTNLANMEKRLAELEKRTDLNPIHFAEARRSYLDMMRQYLRDIKLYEAYQAKSQAVGPPSDREQSANAPEAS